METKETADSGTARAPRNSLSINDIAIFRVGILITLKMAMLLMLNALQGVPNVSH